MSIQPPSDIVLDVANAADPAKAMAATERLVRLGAGASAPPGGFTSALGAAGRDASDTALRSRVALGGTSTDVIDKPVDPRAKAFKGLEALVLQNLVETMLPKDAGAYFGESAGGGMWRSLLAQRIGEQLATRVDLGIASKAAEIHGTPSMPIPNANTGLAADVSNVAARGARL